MTVPILNRRLLLQSGALAAGTLAVDGRLAAPADVPPAPLEGRLAAWVLLRPEQGAEIRLAHFDRGGRLAGQAALVRLTAETLASRNRQASAWGQLRRACAHAEALAVSAAARFWGVPPPSARWASARSRMRHRPLAGLRRLGRPGLRPRPLPFAGGGADLVSASLVPEAGPLRGS